MYYTLHGEAELNTYTQLQRSLGSISFHGCLLLRSWLAIPTLVVPATFWGEKKNDVRKSLWFKLAFEIFEVTNFAIFNNFDFFFYLICHVVFL